MIINHTYKFIFVHVPKNAGTSVTQALSTLSSWRDQEIGGTQLGEALSAQYMKRFGMRKHSPASQIKSVVGEEIWDTYFKFGFVRDPFARLNSVWGFLNKWRDWPRSEIMDEFGSIDKFIASDFFKSGGPDQILKPQTHFLNLPLNYLGSCDTTNRDFKTILDAIGVPADQQPEVGVMNESRSEQIPLSEASRKIVETVWSSDLDLIRSLKVLSEAQYGTDR
jgi:hypothetical protein